MKQLILSILLLIAGIAQAATEEHEAEYDLFLSKTLRINPGNDEGRVDIPIRDLANPLDHTFDLSGFGDTGRYISIHTGYKKAMIPANAGKVEIWFTPKFLVEENLGGDAAWMREIMATWSQPYGIIWTWGGEDVKSDNFDYLVNKDILLDGSKNLCAKWSQRSGAFKFEAVPFLYSGLAVPVFTIFLGGVFF